MGPASRQQPVCLLDISDANFHQQPFQPSSASRREDDELLGLWLQRGRSCIPEKQSLLFQFKKFGCLSTDAAGGSGAAERDNPFTFRRGTEAVSPVDLQETNQWNHTHAL